MTRSRMTNKRWQSGHLGGEAANLCTTPGPPLSVMIEKCRVSLLLDQEFLAESHLNGEIGGDCRREWNGDIHLGMKRLRKSKVTSKLHTIFKVNSNP